MTNRRSSFIVLGMAMWLFSMTLPGALRGYAAPRAFGGCVIVEDCHI